MSRAVHTPYTWIIGLGNDETNSIGPHITGIVDENSDALIDFIEWL